MTLLTINMPVFPSTPEVAKRRFEDHFNLTRYPLSKYLTLEDAILLYPKHGLTMKIICSRRFFAYQLNNREILVHPEGLIKQVGIYYRRKLKSSVQNSEVN